ncbi:MAG TPA: hypothetical protein VG815_08125 [Chloroflexota bacterium]|jgi:hypothetical protein|nr:hypothetical protein [Chloroflexota bacterium]
MINDFRRPETSPRGPEARAGPYPERSAYFLLIQDLVRLRQLVLERLNLIETLARQHPPFGPRERELAAMEEALKTRSDEVEATRRGLQEQAEREKRDWNASLSQLQDDRRLLAEAWERLEQARIETSSTRCDKPSFHSHGQKPPKAGSTGRSLNGCSITLRSAGADSDAHDAVDQAILRQFQTLHNDVRRSARARRPAR